MVSDLDGEPVLNFRLVPGSFLHWNFQSLWETKFSSLVSLGTFSGILAAEKGRSDRVVNAAEYLLGR